MLQQPVSSRVLVGRSEELAALQERLRSAAAGRGSTVLVSGEAGIGKSRLVSEVRQQAALVLRGNCFEPDSALPFAPILDLLRTYVARKTPAEIAASLGPDSSDLSRLLPELAAGIDAATPAPVPDTEQEKRRLFEGLIRFFARLSEDEPLLLIVEDLHWSDDTSLEFILHLSRRVPTLPILLLLTYRSDEVQPGLQRLLATLDRERGASELALRPLTLEEVDVLLRSMFEQPQPIRPDFLHEIYTLTEGNAFFIEEIVGSLIASGDIYRAGDRWDRKALPELSIPRSVRHAVTQRSENLSPDARRVLQVAAVAGQRFVFDVLLDLTGHDESDLLRLVRELINAQLVVEESAERFAFRHALTREAVYAGLLVRERQAIHRALGETIERLYAGSPSMPFADLAYHFHTAQAWEKALLYAPLAGQRAQELYTPRAAIEHFSRALDAAWQLSETPAVNIYRERGLAHETLGEFDPARRDYEVVLERSRAAGDRRSEWRALMDLGGLWAGYDYARAGGYFEQALQLAQETGDRADVARSLVQVGNWQVNTERPAEAERSLQDALAIFREIDDRHAIAETLDLLGIVADISGDLVRMCDYLNQAIDLYRVLDDRRGLASTLTTSACGAGVMVFDASVVPPDMTLTDAVKLIDESLQIVREIGWRSGEAYTLVNLGLHLTHKGRFGPALDAAHEGLRIAEETEHREWLTAGTYLFGQIYTDLGDSHRSREWMARAYSLAHASGSAHFVSLIGASLAMTCVDGNDIDAAVAVLSEFDPQRPVETAGQRFVWWARAVVALAQGQPETTLEIIDRLFSTAVNFNDRSDIPHLAYLQGRALEATGRLDEAEATLFAARTGAEWRDMQPLVWRVHRTLGDLYQRLDRQDEAEREFEAARSVINTMAATIGDDTMRDEFLARALEHIPDGTQFAESRELTPREREVTMLIAQGMSNREIADTLYVGERTVETHVSNVLGKLGFTSRTQIAAWAVETGLATIAGTR